MHAESAVRALHEQQRQHREDVIHAHVDHQARDDILAADRVRNLFFYDQETGIFTWRVAKAQRVKVGDIAGSLNGDGYVLISIDNRKHKAHRLAWLYVSGAWPMRQIDHINGDRSDNRIFNLRDVTHQANSQNVRLARSSNRSTGLLGSTRHSSGRFQARICVDGKRMTLGLFDTPQMAHEAYVKAKRELHIGSTT